MGVKEGGCPRDHLPAGPVDISNGGRGAVRKELQEVWGPGETGQGAGAREGKGPRGQVGARSRGCRTDRRRWSRRAGGKTGPGSGQEVGAFAR